MNQNETMYRIDLEDYACPRFVSKPKAYLGTKEEITELMSHLSANSYSAMRYAQTIEAVDRYELDPDGVHFVAGQERPVLMPVEVLVEQSTVVVIGFNKQTTKYSYRAIATNRRSKMAPWNFLRLNR